MAATRAKPRPLAHLTAAAQARHTASPAGTLARKAAGCAVVVLSQARTTKGALKMLAASSLPDEVRDATADLINRLSAQQAESHPNQKETTR